MKFLSFTSGCWRGSKGEMKIPALTNSVIHEVSRDAFSFCPFGYGKADSFVFNNDIRRFISALLNSGRPAAIIDIVVSIIVDSIKLVLGRWTFAHVGKEVIKQHPAITNGDASPPIAVIHPRSGVQASGLHRSPNVVLRLMRLAMTKAVVLSEVANCFHVHCRHLAMKAATGANCTRVKLADVYCFCVATIATAFNKPFATGRNANNGVDSQTTGFETNQHIVRYAFHS